MILEFPKAPMHYQEGIPAYKAGEWEGIKSCKFMPTRRIIRPATHGIIFNDNKTFAPMRRVISQEPSKEYEFKPSIRIIDTSFMNKPKKERGEKLHYFPYREEAYKVSKEKDDSLTAKTALDQEFRLINNLGIKKNNNMTNFALLSSIRKREGLNTHYNSNYSTFGAFNRPYEYYGKEPKIENLKMTKMNFKNDNNYVKNLDNWEKNFLPKITN